MISLEKIISANLDMLKEQENSLAKSLSIVQKAIQLFESEGTKRGKRSRRRKRGRPTKNLRTISQAKQKRRTRRRRRKSKK
jgi:hypothetical protein